MEILKVTGLFLLAVIIVLGIAAAVFCYNNLHWWEKDMKKIEKLGVWEKQVALPGGRIINYGEMGGNGPALLLIHYITWT